MQTTSYATKKIIKAPGHAHPHTKDDIDTTDEPCSNYRAKRRIFESPLVHIVSKSGKNGIAAQKKDSRCVDIL